MSFEHLPEKARNSDLIQTLDLKLELPPQVEFDYRGELVRLAKQVTADVAHINELFPEYTPHDAQYHLNRLFHVADLVVGKVRFDELNAAELFILAASLYAHDWGMAVSRPEKQAVLELAKGQVPADQTAILPDEKARLLKFAASRGCKPTEIVETLRHWRDYIRETHPERSAHRSRLYFKIPGGGMGDAVARVSRGHGIDIAELEKVNEFPIDFSVHGLNANLRGLAVYVRLIDLLDIADDRTPYAVWKFVSPCDSKSAEEWSKHRALNPVTCPEYQNGRMVLVDGSTGDPDVWAALRDLERYVRSQVRECNDLLARMRDTRFHLDLPIVEWRIATPGFTPVDLRFEFQRESMFRILSDEIYDGDVYVFLRELLQNSIDAIRLRSAILARQGLSMSGLVHFEVLHHDKGAATIRCRDNGVGMDVHIIRNYLALAGRSYYSSDEFKHLGLDFDAIAKFGVGILSCFMAAESIEIETRRDPNLSPQSEGLRVVVPAVERQFRVYSGESQQTVGTTITVNVCGDRIKSAPEGWNKKMRVTDYIAEVGGFCEFPILISEDGICTLVLHPTLDANNAIKIASETLSLSNKKAQFKMRKTAQDYPWEEVFLAQDLSKAKELFEVEWFSLQSDINLDFCEGRIAVLVPRDHSLYAQREDEDDGVVRSCFYENLEGDYKSARWYYSQSQREKIRPPRPRSINCSSTCRLSYNGILVAGAHSESRSGISLFPEKAIWINFSRAFGIQLNVARHDSKSAMPHWETAIDESLFNLIIKRSLERIQRLKPAARLFQIAQLMAVYKISPGYIGECLKHDKLPVIRLNSGEMEVLDSEVWREDTWPQLPECFEFQLPEMTEELYFNSKRKGPKRKVLSLWQGECSVACDVTYPNNYALLAIQFVNWVANQVRPVERIRFIQGPRSVDDSIPQLVRSSGRLVADNEIEANAELAILEPAKVPIDFWVKLWINTKNNLKIYNRLECAEFLPPHQSFFAYGRCCLNSLHTVTKTLIRLGIALQFATNKAVLAPAQLGLLNDLFGDLVEVICREKFHRDNLKQALDSCVEEFQSKGLIILDQNLEVPDFSDYVFGSILDKKGGFRLKTDVHDHSEHEFRNAYGVVLGSLD